MVNPQYNPDHVPRDHDPNSAEEILWRSARLNQQTYIESNSSYGQTNEHEIPTPSTQQAKSLDGDLLAMPAVEMPEILDRINSSGHPLPGASPASVHEDYPLESRMLGAGVDVPVPNQQNLYHGKNPTPSQWTLDDYGQETLNHSKSRTHEQLHVDTAALESSLVGHDRTNSWEVQMRLTPYIGIFQKRLALGSQSDETICQQGGEKYNSPQRNPVPKDNVQFSGTGTSFGHTNVTDEGQGPSFRPIASSGVSSGFSIPNLNASKTPALPVNHTAQKPQDVYWSGSNSSPVGYSPTTTRSKPSPGLYDIDEASMSSQAHSPSNLEPWPVAYQVDDSLRPARSGSANYPRNVTETSFRRASTQNDPFPLLLDEDNSQTAFKTPSHSDSSSFLTSQGNRPFSERRKPHGPAQYVAPHASPQWPNFNENVRGTSFQQGFYPDRGAHVNEAPPAYRTGSQYLSTLEASLCLGSELNALTSSTESVLGRNNPSISGVRTYSFGGNPAVRFLPVVRVFQLLHKLNLYLEYTKFRNLRRHLTIRSSIRFIERR